MTKMETNILNKFSDDEINLFIENHIGLDITNVGGFGSFRDIKSLHELQKERINDYLASNKNLFIQINSKEQFLKLLNEKIKFDEYDSNYYSTFIFTFPFYITKSLLLRIGGWKNREEDDLNCHPIGYEKEVNIVDGFFGKKNKITIGASNYFRINGEIVNGFDNIQKYLPDEDFNIYNKIREIELKLLREIEEEINLLTDKAISKLILNPSGKIDIIENDFNKILDKNQKRVIEIDKNYIHQLIKVSNYIKTKRENIQQIYISIKNSKSPSEVEKRIGLLKNQIHTYELLLFNAINMISALVDENLIVFYEIYESFDKLGIFNSNWENDISKKLKKVNLKLDDLMISINKMEKNIVKEISNLNYLTQNSFDELNSSVTNQLKEVKSSINFNNLLSVIQSYQLYKINKNTKTID